MHRGDLVALKTLPTVEGSSLHLFKREFRSLADVNHHNLIGLHTLESDGCHWFFTMDLVDGTDLMSYVRPGGSLDEDRLRSSFAQLVAGVMELHSHQIIHRDLKPSNVMVSHDGRVVVLDFGLVLETDRANVSQTGKFAGTPLYMAPEQAANGTLTPAADWYAVGGMLYQALMGNPPFGGSFLEILQKKQQVNAPPIEARDELPVDLREVCMKLLERDPSNRPDIRQLAEAFSTEAVENISPQAEQSEQLIGRDEQIEKLESSYQKFLSTREPVSVFVSGRSGEGKSILCDHFLTPLRSNRQLNVMSGRCYDREKPSSL